MKKAFENHLQYLILASLLFYRVKKLVEIPLELFFNVVAEMLVNFESVCFIRSNGFGKEFCKLGKLRWK